MLASIVNNLFKSHVLHDWTEIDCYRYCDCGTLQECDCPGASEVEVNWKDVSKDPQAVSDFKLLAGQSDYKLN
ncbi:MAG: hypothetical protein LWX83_15625 [Anaerolineae bacterium]|nr:hypothetical protein [Anaerolineae bacterium]